LKFVVETALPLLLLLDLDLDLESSLEWGYIFREGNSATELRRQKRHELHEIIIENFQKRSRVKISY
jgi:hypothetical protein